MKMILSILKFDQNIKILLVASPESKLLIREQKYTEIMKKLIFEL